MPEHQMVTAMLEDALRLYARYARRRNWTTKRNDLQARRDGFEAEAWIFSNDEHPFSFLWACDLLRLDADYLREQCRTATPRRTQLHAVISARSQSPNNRLCRWSIDRRTHAA